MIFSAPMELFIALIAISIGLTAISTIVLLAMILRDWRKGTLW